MAAAEKLITANLDIWSSVIKAKSAAGRGKSNKLELYGIKKLRELILELAIRGLLMPQDPNDEPASELLKKIATEKAKLLKDGKIKKPKALPSIEDDEKPFVLPEGWDWVRLGDVTNYGTCDKAEARDAEQDTWVLELEDVEKVSSKLLGKVRFRDRQFRSSKNVFISGDVIYGKLRPYLDKVIVADENGVCTTEMIPVRGYACLVPSFLRLAMKSPSFIAYANDSTHGMNLPRMGTDKARLALIPLLAEDQQAGIVAKVDELMALCDQLEQHQESSIVAHRTLVQTLLDALTTASERDGFTAAWARIADHFDTLFTTEWSIDQLKQTILQLAVMGKLVPQDPNDEPASELLKKIAAEKAQLVKDGKIKKQKALPAIKEVEKPFKLPAASTFERLGNVLTKITDGTHHSPPNIESGDYLYISAKNIKNEGVQLSNATYVTEKVHQEIYARCNPEFGDLLYIKDGATTGIATINQLHEPFSMSSSVALLKCPEGVSNQFLLLSLRAPYFYAEMRAGMTGVAITRVTLKKLNHAVMALPPLPEQKRIVAKVDELMALCDILKNRLNTAQTTQFQLADAMAEKAVA